MTTFSLPDNIRRAEELGLSLEFQEVKKRGSDKIFCQVIVTEHGEVDLRDIYEFSSWEEMKKQYPTMIEFLVELSKNEYWFSSWRDYDRIYFIAEIDGNEGLYDLHDTVWFDAQELQKNNELINELIQKELSPPVKKKSTKKIKK